MHPTAARASRSSIQSSIPSASTPSSLVHPQQQQILYGPIANPTLTLQACGSGLHPSCIYPGTQRNAGLANPAPLHIQGKSSRWPAKNKLVRSQQYCQQQQQQQHIQQQLSYSPKPLVLYDQTTNNAPIPPPTTSFLIASSTYTHGSFSGDQYNNSGITLIPQPYFKPPDVQTFCLIQDRQNIQQQEQLSHSSYYNISATNTCNLQTINGNSAFQFPNLNPYAATANFTNGQVTGPVQTVHSNQIYPNHPASLVYGSLQRDKPVVTAATLDIAPLKVGKNKIPTVDTSRVTPISSENYDEWPLQTITSPCNDLFNIKPSTEDEANRETKTSSSEKATSNVCTKAQEEHYSDESSTSFDFTIEAEKMVSALCNISSNDINKEETKTEKSNSTPLFSGAGDTASNKNTWFTEFCADYGSGTSIAVQTDGPCLDRTQYPELLRKVIYWGCTEAEIVLNDSCKTNARCSWLKNLSTATKTAVTKSSTCFPIFAGDRVFVGDLINALLRISNGWLVLDNYLNKQHYPSLNDKFDCELLRCFRLWEESTHELLNQIIHAFLKLEENGNASNFEQRPESFGTSFPGDVSVYTNRDLFDPSSTMITSKQKPDNKKNNRDSSNGAQLSTGSLRNFSLYNSSQEKQPSQKESKLRSKWTVTENLTTIDSTKSVPDMFLGHAEPAGQPNSRFRSRGSSSSAKTDTSTQSLNAEFFHLRSKILTESNQDPSRQWLFKEKKQEFPENKVSPQENADTVFRLQRQLDENCESNYAQKCLSRVESSFLNPSISLESIYFPATNDHENFYPSYAICPPYTVDYGNKNSKSFEQNHRNKTNMDLVYVGKSSTSQLELAAVPKDKMTLLSQIEPSIPEKSSEEMTANLSAWFASMRNSDNRQMPFMNPADVNTETVVPRGSTRAEMSKNAMDLGSCIRQLHIDANRQFHTLQNIQSVQTTPWNAYNLISNRVQVQQVPEEYDSSEDVRVYMKPGSYNVPKKRHQRRSNRRLESSASRNVTNGTSNNHRNHYVNNKEKTFCGPASSTPVSRPTATPISNDVNTFANTMKVPFPATPIVPPPTFSLENSPRILKRSDTSNYTVSEDVTWKAACASAEILLEALNVKEDTDFKKTEIDRVDVSEKFESVKENENDDTTSQAVQDREKLDESLSKNLKDSNDGCGGVSSYEASEDDSGSTNHFSLNTSINEALQLSGNKNGSSKMNVKTDSWLIKTLNNANMANKQKRRKNNAVPHSSESSNSSVTENEQPAPVVSLVTNSTVTTVATTTMVKNLQQTICSRKSSCISLNNGQTTLGEAERVIGKATYSETLRRCASLSTSFSEKKEFCKKSKLNIANVSTICSTVIPIPGRKCQRKDFEKSYYLLHNRSRKCSGKKATKNFEVNDTLVEGTSKSTIATKHGKKRENSGCIEFLDGKFGGKASDRGWSVWYSSKRKQSLSPLALSKLEMIHQTVWQMEEAEIFKCPSSGSNNGKQSSSHTIEDYCKVIKSPMFLETVEYKLKNRVYHKVEHVVRDFRRIVYNSKLYHKDDHDRVKTIEILSKKLEELFEEHFASWDFDNISGSPRESSPVLHRFKTAGQKPVTGRYGNTKKCPSSSITDNI
ncbi:uncharacterized protein LOC100651530 [Bombus terrestris]|uniref:Uncharacterized protein LOC100651530 n=1 Tax=Bombus terrestris TaxID=30195 RepID=A0A9B2JS85_BOMTE|nr:uncharacterized protein LOC100651530 [Bombus terrestris]